MPAGIPYVASILVVNGRNQGEWYTVGQRAMVFGRDDELLAEILDPCVSRRHLEVRFDTRDQCYYAVDMNSRNGVRVNGQRIQGIKALADEDVVRIGHTLLVFTFTEFVDDRNAQAFLKQSQQKHRDTIDALVQEKRERIEKTLHST